MLSISAQHKAARLALVAMQREQESHATATGRHIPVAEAGTAFDVIMASLASDLAALSDIQDVKGKQALKEKILPKYLKHVQEYIESGAHYSNPVLVRCAIWCIDVGDLEAAMQLATVAIEQQQLAPESFKRDLPTFLTESITEWAERQLKEKQSGSPYIDAVTEHLVNNTWPVTHTIVRGKAFKVAGQLAEQNGDYSVALAYYEAAQEENEAAGCKTRIAQLKTRLGK